MDPLIISALLGAGSSLLGPKPKVDPVSKELSAWMKQYGPPALAQLNAEATTPGLNQSETAQWNDTQAATQLQADQLFRMLAGRNSAAGLDSRGNLAGSLDAQAATGMTNKLAELRVALNAQAEARRQNALRLLLGAVTGNAGVAAGGFQTANNTANNQQQAFADSIKEMMMLLKLKTPGAPGGTPANPNAQFYQNYAVSPMGMYTPQPLPGTNNQYDADAEYYQTHAQYGGNYYDPSLYSKP